MGEENSDVVDSCDKKDIADCTGQEEIASGSDQKNTENDETKSCGDCEENGLEGDETLEHCYVEGYLNGYDAGSDLKKCRDRQPKTCCRESTLLKCSAPATITLQLPVTARTVLTVASLELNTSHFCNPCIHFEFACNIVTTAAIINIDFQILGLCQDQLVPFTVSSVWSYSTGLPVTSADAFSFSACRCSECEEDCCNFNVRAMITGGGATAGDVSIRNATLSAFVTEKSCNN